MNDDISSMPSKWEECQCDLDVEYNIFQTYRCQFTKVSSGQSGNFVIIRSHDWVQVIAETVDNHIVMALQFRFGSRELSLELPGGIMDPGEDVISAARRELVEETGYTGGDATVIGTLFPNPAIQTNRLYVVHIKNCTLTHPTNFDECEDIQTLLYSRDDVIHAIQNGNISHCITISAIAKFLELR